MRRSFTRAGGAALLAGLVLAGTTTVAGAAPPDDTDPADDRDALALEQFTDLAERSGFTLADPACSSSPDDLTFTCYAMTTAGGPFIARTTLSPADVVEFEILAAPGQPATATPASPGAAAGGATFDALSYFDHLFSGDPDEIAALQQETSSGSPAESYAIFQLTFAQTIQQFGGDLLPSYVYLTPDGVLLCVTESDCALVDDLEVVDGQLVSFAVDGYDIAPRLARAGRTVTVGTATVTLRAAYRSVTGNGALRVYLQMSGNDNATFELSNAVYVDADGKLTPVDRETSIGAVDIPVKGELQVALDFAGVDPGGEVRFLIYPADGAPPLAAVVAIEAFAEPEG